MSQEDMKRLDDKQRALRAEHARQRAEALFECTEYEARIGDEDVASRSLHHACQGYKKTWGVIGDSVDPRRSKWRRDGTASDCWECVLSVTKE